ncbi:MAG: hypothetical protein ACK6C0_00415 [Betaproteobacteria bacterium]
MSRLAALLLAVLLAGCAAPPAAPDWQRNARGALDLALAAYLKGDGRVAAAEFDRARRELTRSGQRQAVAQAEVLRCAAAVASLVFEPCAGFEALRVDASAAQRAYAEYLAGRLDPAQAELLPLAQRALAAKRLEGEAATAALRAIDDPLARLVAAAVLVQTGRADAQAVALAVDTASAQGWRRPLLAWLKAQLALAEKADRTDEARSIRRRIDLTGGD